MHALPRSAPRWYGTIPLVAAVLSASLIAAPARAQDAPSHLGIVFGGGVGVLWQVNDHTALRPALSISGGKSQVGTNWTAGPSLSLLRTIKAVDDAAVYWAPGLGYSHTWATPTTSDAYSLSVHIGVRQRVARRMSVYAEIGPSYTETRARTSLPPATTITSAVRNWGIGSGFTVVWYVR